MYNCNQVSKLKYQSILVRKTMFRSSPFGEEAGKRVRLRPGPLCTRTVRKCNSQNRYLPTSLSSSRITFDLPELLDIQRASFHNFVKKGIPDLLSQTTPIKMERENIAIELSLNSSQFQLIAPDETPRDCILQMKTYSCKLYIQAQIVYRTLSGKFLYKTRSEWILIGHLPIMTKRGHFIINGSPRVIVHQVVRSPGIYFQQVVEKDDKKRMRFYGDIIPRKGVWLRLQTTKKGKIEAKLKKGKRVSADILQKCLQLLEKTERHKRQSFLFTLKRQNQNYQNASFQKVNSYKRLFKIPLKFQERQLTNTKALANSRLPNFVSPVSLNTVPKLLINSASFSTISTELSIQEPEMINLASVSEEKALLYTYNKLYRPIEDKEREEKSRKVKNRSFSSNLLTDQRFKLKKCYKNLFSTFKEKSRYDLGNLGREKINQKLEIHVSGRQLSALDIYSASNWLNKLLKGEKNVDDIDHFQNRRIRTSGELLHIQFESGIDRLKKVALSKLKDILHQRLTQKVSIEPRSKAIVNKKPRVVSTLRENGNSTGLLTMSPSSLKKSRLINKNQHVFLKSLSGTNSWQKRKATQVANYKNAPYGDLRSTVESKLAFDSLKELFSTKPLNGALRELFGSNPLSQYMDQTNPLAEITHKRRMSSLGIGGVSRESAGMAIRGIHPTHYGRICPIETPEGKNAGLVNSLAFYAKINDKGFVETPYYKVVKGQVQYELGFSFVEAKSESASHFNIAPSDLQQSWSNMLVTESVPVRAADNILDLFKKIDCSHVDCIGVSPIQMISVATSLIPFLEHNDANRALMGSNMQRQAVPLMISERPIVGTGLESLVLAESGHVLQSKMTGFVSYVSASKIVVEYIQHALVQKRIQQRINSFDITFSLHPVTIGNYTPTPLTSSYKQAQSACLTSGLACPEGLFAFRRARKVKSKERARACPECMQAPPGGSQRVSPTNMHVSRSRGVGPTAADKTSHHNFGQYVFQLPFNKIKKIKKHLVPIRKHNLAFYSFIHSNKIGWQAVSSKKFYRRVKHSLAASSIAFQPIRAAQTQFNQPHYFYKRMLSNTPLKLSGIWFNNTLSQASYNLKSSVHIVSHFDRSNQDTCLTQRALVQEGDWVQRGDILTDCSASDQGELAVGKNILVAYIPWEGYNFEDAIVISERLVKEHVYTSLHVERYDFNAQDLKEGREWFTNDLPGIPTKKLTHLDESGLPKIGTFVKEGDILVGKMRYSNKKPTTPYERLLCDILGESNFSARDSSLYVPKGVNARVIKNKIITLFEDRSLYSRSEIGRSPKLVHIFLGEKRTIQVGDKMSGRHGNKGVVSTVLPRQDMPYLSDGTPIDIILNPLGVPSRMNVGQVFEALLGLAGTYLAQHFKIMSFDELYGVEASQSLVYLKLYQARLQSGQNWLFQVDFPGKTRLTDGRSGQCFDQWITVGRAYILKLIHMVNEKIHARATGPYALITQQPLRGRSQKGGQRLGEMEVWALEGFGAAYTLQELLTKKSDDMIGRKQVASSILPRPISILDAVQPFSEAAPEGVSSEKEALTRIQENKLILGQPEIFKVLICELQALCLDVGVYSLTPHSFQRSFLNSAESIKE